MAREGHGPLATSIHGAPMGKEESPNTTMLGMAMLDNSEQFHIDWGRSINTLVDDGQALMGQLQSLRA
eukprot:8068775-Pyramimonas_sp.AAC.1